MDSELTFFVLLVLSIPVIAIIALVLSVGLRNRTALLEMRIKLLEQAVERLTAAPAKSLAQQPAVQSRAPPASTAWRATPATPAEPHGAAGEEDGEPKHVASDATSHFSSPASEAVQKTGQKTDQAAPPQAGQTAAAPPPGGQQPARPGGDASGSGRGGLEEKLGARWSVWVGALALAIGGLMLVRFSIEEGYFGPAARIILGLALGAGLVGGGEWLRRRDLRAGRPVATGNHPFATPGAPAALTAAGAATVFGSVYAAYALYDFIGPAAAFIALGVVAVLTMSSAVLQGPALAAFGLPAALAAPLLISSSQPRLWPLTLYVAAVVASAYGLARIRHWRWLAIAAALGAWLWGLALVAAGYGSPLAANAHVIIQLALAAAALAVEPHWRTADRDARPDGFALIVLAGCAVLGVASFDLPLGPPARILTAGAMAGLLFAIGWRLAPVAAATLLAGAVSAGALWNWRVVALATQEPQTLAPGGVGSYPMPENLTVYLGFAIVAALVISAGALRRLLAGRDLPLFAAASYAAAATLTPLALMSVVWMRTASFAPSIPFGIVAAALALAGAALTARLRSGAESDAPNHQLATGAMACAAIAAIALGLTFVLDKGMLTVAFALTAPGIAWVAVRLQLPALRYAAGAIGFLVLGRIIWNPAIAASGAIGATPVFNWLLWGYGVPAVAFAVTSVLLARQRRDRITGLCEGLAIIFSALLVLFEIRHALNGGDPFRAASDHLEAGLLATSALLFSMALTRMNGRRTDLVYRIASLGFALISLVIVIIGLLILANPLFTGEVVLGGALFNSLIPAYLAPALAAASLVWMSKDAWPRWRTLTTAGMALLLFTSYVMLAIRHYFQGPDLAFWRHTGEAEWWCYTAALLAMGVALLAWGLLRRRRLARLASAPFILAAVLKAFLFDMANLDGVWRALSLIGLGLVLIGIARAYQLLLYPASHSQGDQGAERDQT